MEQGFNFDMGKINELQSQVNELEEKIDEYQKYIINCNAAILCLYEPQNGIIALYEHYPRVNSGKTSSGIDPIYEILQKHALKKSDLNCVIPNQESNIEALKDTIKQKISKLEQKISKLKSEIEELKTKGLLRVHL